jgi:hypothetical protein
MNLKFGSMAAVAAEPSMERTVERPGAWFADPYGQAELRWWSGSQWTQIVRGEGAAPQAKTAPRTPSDEVYEGSTVQRLIAPYIAPTAAGLAERRAGVAKMRAKAYTGAVSHSIH